jgi:hypothetical protein
VNLFNNYSFSIIQTLTNGKTIWSFFLL